MWIITEHDVAINLDNVITIESEQTANGEYWKITAYLVDGDERSIGYEENAEEALYKIRELIGKDKISKDLSV